MANTALGRDANRVPFNTDAIRSASSAVAFDGTIGAVGTATLFNVTGEVIVRIFGACSENIAGTIASASVGVLGETSALIATTLATDIDNNEIWRDATPTSAVETFSNVVEFLVINGQDIVYEIAGTALSDGTITFHCLWKPISEDGNVTA